MIDPLLTPEVLRREYQDEGLSIGEIARRHERAPSKVRRLLIQYGIPRRDYRQAQQQALRAGRQTHPTAGKPVPAERRLELSRKNVDYWRKQGKGQKEAYRQRMRETLAGKWKEEAHEACRDASRRGSRLERFLVSGLSLAGYSVEFHVRQRLAREELELDLWLPQQRVAIEVNGPSHYRPIWGEDKLKRTQQGDAHKRGLCQAGGVSLVVIRHEEGKIPACERQRVLERLLALLEKSLPPGDYQEIVVHDPQEG